VSARRPRTRRAARPRPARDDATPLWRYVTYPVYLELLRARSLHFTRVDQLDPDDPYEGRFLLPEEWAEVARAGRAEACDAARAQFAVSCWCAAEGERTSLWERYASPFGVALKTTLGRLRRALRGYGASARVGAVVYAEDPALARDGGVDILRWMLRKRRAFEDEQEIRAVVWSLGARRGEAWPAGGVDVPVSPGALLEEVWVGPPWTRWFHEQVRDVSRLLGFPGSRVRRSALMDPPEVPGGARYAGDGGEAARTRPKSRRHDGHR
jgi:hypothetical protein